ncbi:MAG TPA: LamG-like jellyroll fold domain-containing protein [Lutibacter sp.]
MKKTILLFVIYLCNFKGFPQTISDTETFKKSLSFKKRDTITFTKKEGINILFTAETILFDSDGDGIFDDVDIDDDNDGIKDTDEENFCRNSPISAKGIYCDTDNDGVPDILDLDSDNDGIPDVVEAGFGHLSEGRATLTACSTWVDANLNGMHDLTEGIIPLDSDGDGVPNYLDLDSDNDSIFDVDESGTGNLNAPTGYVNGDGDINGDGVGDGPDTDYARENDIDKDGILEYYTDGILDIFDYFNGTTFNTSYGNSNQGVNPLYLKDSDNDGIPDYIDIKSNGTTFDIAGTLYAHLDTNNDGLIDGTADIDRDGILDLFDTNTNVFGSPRDLNQKLHLYFDGRNDYIEEDNGTNIVNGLPEATMMAWIKLDPEFSTHGAIMGQTNFWVRINGSRRLRVEIPDNKSFTAPATTALPLNNWTHIAAVFNGTDTYEKVKLYINGEKVAGTNPAGLGITIPTSSNTKFRIGRAPSNGDIYNSTADMFKGEMDEVRVFNKALSEDELQKMVYQELDGTNGFNSGLIIPRDISPFIGTSLVRYFRMDVFKDNIVDNLTTPAIDIGSGAKMYNIKNIYPQTAPLPYETKADGDWSNSSNWLHGNIWDIASEATNKDWAIVHIKNNITTSKSHSIAGLIVDKGNELSIKTSKELKNTWYLELDGVIDLEDESQLVQTENSILDQDSGGYIEGDQQGTANSFNYNYWASPVGPISGTAARGTGIASTNKSYKLVDVLYDGTGIDGTGGALPYPKKINFQPAYWAADNGITKPIIISSYWLHTFNGTNNNYGAWKSINENTLLLAGEGYTMKGTSGNVNIGTLQNYVFKGKPNNGDFTLPIAAGNNRLIGNPYPSAMDANKFIDDNIKDGGNNTTGNVFNGALYFWDHFGEMNSHYLKEYVGGYATYTKMGGAKAYSNDARINNNGSLGNKRPRQYIPVGQGFFVIAVTDTLKNSIHSPIIINGGDIVFKNSQRIFMTESTSNSVFMKGINTKYAYSSDKGGKDSIVNNEGLDKRAKIWLQFDSPAGYHRQLLVGADENASIHFDLGYDAPIADLNKEDMFWTIGSGKFVIQAVNNFNSDQELSLGFIVNKKGLARIRIDETENMNEDTMVYIKDNLLGKSHNISRTPFEIELTAGKYTDRFAITFKTSKLVAEDVAAEALTPFEAQHINQGIHVYMNNAIGELQIKNNSDDEILSVALINSLGQTVRTWNSNLNRRTISLPVNTATGVYMVQIITKNGSVVQKVIVE